MYTDIIIGKCTSLLGNKCAAIYYTDFHWAYVEPMKERNEVSHTLESLFRTAGIPKCLRPDGGKELVDGEFRKKATRFGTPIFPNERFAKNANIASGLGVRELKREYRRDMIPTGAPECLWDPGLTYRAFVMCHTAWNISDLERRYLRLS